jgi:hypothetical protein
MNNRYRTRYSSIMIAIASVFLFSLAAANAFANANLLSDGSFEAGNPIFIGSAPPTTTGQWLYFPHFSVESGDPSGMDAQVPDFAHDGTLMVKTFGPFNTFPDAAGVLQNIAAQPGEKFHAEAWAQTPSGDSILGTQNLGELQLAFLDAGAP